MKKNILIFIVVFRVSAQGIEFNHISLNEAIKKAKAENKLVFVDFYTAWCAPCKAMEKGVFPLPEVGNVYNEEYVSIKLDAEKEGLEDAKKYQVKSYPTYLYLNANGNVVYKETGARPTEDFIKLGREAAASVSSKYSLEKLRANFSNKQNDANFLKIYIDKMLEYGQNPLEGIEAWLKVQKEIDEDDVDMMEFLLKYKKYILLDSKGEEILNSNFDEYMDIATKKEETDLEKLKVQIAQNTKDYAYETKDPELWLTFMRGFNKLPENIKSRGNIMEYKMIYHSMIKDYKGYKMIIENYVDSLMNSNSISNIKIEDKETYEKKVKTLEMDKSPDAIRKLEAYKNGIKGGDVVKDLCQKAEAYLKYIDAKGEYKTLEGWIDYGYKVGSSTYYIDNLMANMYYKKGKTKKAIEYKEKALSNWPQGDKRLSAEKYALKQMLKGESM